MINSIDTIEMLLRWLAACAGAGTLTYAIISMVKAQRQQTGVLTGAAGKVLRTPYLVIATVLFIALGYSLWKPLPIQLAWQLQLGCMVIGGSIFFASLFLYLWGLRTLGRNFNAASGFGVRLHEAHQLVTQGPYATIRHPMYLAAILAFWGGLLLFRSLTMLVFAVLMLGLIYRAAREEEALAQAFGPVWQDYKNRVPGWIARLGKSNR